MPKILAFVHAYVGHGRNAGAETTLHDTLRALVAHGWEAEVLLSKENTGVNADYTIDGVKVYQHRHKTEFPQRAETADVLITHLECSSRTVLIGKQVKKPVVHLVHNSLWQTEGYLAQGADFAIYNTQWISEHHEAIKKQPFVKALKGESSNSAVFKTRHCYEWPSMVLHPIVNPEHYKTPTSGEFVTLVNLFKNKGPHVFYNLAEVFPDKKFLAVYGGYGEQEIRSDLPNVTFMKNVHDPREIYAKTKVILMPSKYESFGRVAVEAAASGIPAVVSNTPGLVEALDYAGNFAPRDDFYQWMKQLRALLENDDHYEDSRQAALRRSEELWVQNQIEIEELVNNMNALVA